MKKIILTTTLTVMLITIMTVNSFAMITTVSNPTALGQESAIYINGRQNGYRVESNLVPSESILDIYKETPILVFDSFLTMTVINRTSTNQLVESYSYYTTDASAQKFGIFVSNYVKRTENDKTYYMINFIIDTYNINTGMKETGEHLTPSTYPTAIREDIVYIYGIYDQVDKMPSDYNNIYKITPLKWYDYEVNTYGSYKEGYDVGKADGLKINQEEAYQQGKKEGIAQGKIEGYQKAQEDFADTTIWQRLVDAVINAPINAIKGLLNFEIMGMDMLPVAKGIFSIIVIMAILGLVVKFIL